MDEPESQPDQGQPQAVEEEFPEAQDIEVSSEEPVHTLDHVDLYLRIGQDASASDIHLAVNVPPSWRLYGNLVPIWDHADVLRAADTESLALGFLTE